MPSESQLQQHTAKRKAEDPNPLLAAAKRIKKDKSGASNKRKLLNAEETPTGLLIVRAPPQDSSFSLSQPVASSSRVPSPPRASSSQPLPRNSSSDPPLKKFRASSQPSTSQLSRQRSAPSPIPEDAELESAVRAMNDEADHLRRQSRAPTLMDQNSNPAFQFQPLDSTPVGKSGGRDVVTDSSLRIPQTETPQIKRNKRMRAGAMAAIISEREEEEFTGETQDRRQNHRRRSSVSRGKRISSSFENAGVISSPHNSVSETSFYKHIDADLPDSERLRQLLIWCAIRASGTTTFSSSSTPSKPKTAVSSAALPPLSAKASQLFKNVQDDIIRMLAERKIDLSLYGPDSTNQAGSSGAKLRENEQNLKNKDFEVKYSQQIRQLEEEEDQWKKTSYHYEAYSKKFAVMMEKRSAAAAALSSKAKGKQRQVEDDLEDALSDAHTLPPDLRHSLNLARSVLHQPSASSQSSTSIITTRRGNRLTREDLTSAIGSLFPDFTYKLDCLHSYVNAARSTTRVAEDMLDERFKLLSVNLEKRRRVDLEGTSRADTKHGVEVARNYVQKEGSHVATASDSTGGGDGGGGIMDLMRALSRVDTARPPSKIGDSVRRAAREVQRIGESGIGERRLTAVYTSGGSGQIQNAAAGGNGGMATPRKTPGTPRRQGTPKRERTPAH